MFFMAFGITVMIISIKMPRFEEFDANPYSVPGIVPGFLGAVVAFLGLILFVRSLIRKGYQLGLNGTTLKGWFREEGTKRLVLTLSFCLVYALILIGRLPYPVATVLFIFAFIFVFEYKKGVPLKNQMKMIFFALLLALLSGLSIWAVFRYLFLVNLP